MKTQMTLPDYAAGPGCGYSKPLRLRNHADRSLGRAKGLAST